MIDEIQSLAVAIWEHIYFLIRLITKITTGFIIVPAGIAVDFIKEDWEKAAVPVKIASAILLVPLSGILFFAAPWWDDFEVVD